MRIKHWQGYGTVSAVKVKDRSCTLHIRVSGNHEWGLEREDMYDLYNWLVKRFDKSVPDYLQWYRAAREKTDRIVMVNDRYENDEEVCDYMFVY